MGCCFKLGTDAVLANLFAGSEYPAAYTIDEIRRYAEFLTEKMPGYITADINEASVRKCCVELPELYTLSCTEDGRAVISSGRKRPDAAFLMGLYSSRTARRVRLLTEAYLAAPIIHTPTEEGGNR